MFRAKLAARVRVYSRGHGRNTDKDDAVSGWPPWTAPDIRPVMPNGDLVSLRLLCGRREELGAQWTQGGLPAAPAAGRAHPGREALRPSRS